MEIPTQITNLQQQIDTWKGEVDNVRRDVKEMRSRLEELVTQQGDQEKLIHVEHFQNRFIRQLEVADEMFHDLKQSSRKILGGDKPLLLHDDRPVEDYDGLHDRMETFHKLYSELKGEFNGFIL